MEQSDSKPKQTGRTRDTLFRITYQHQSQLIQIADYKANMNISLCAMIISAIIAVIGYGAVSGRIDNYSSLLIIPIAIIILTCLLSLIFAIQSARPKILTTAHNVKSSLLFFGEIAEHSQPDYIRKMKDLLESDTEMYEHMILDIHNQGIILKRKYNLLRKSYQILMYGFTLTVIIFIAVILMGI